MASFGADPELATEPVPEPEEEHVATGEAEVTEVVDTDGDGAPDADDAEPDNPGVQ